MLLQTKLHGKTYQFPDVRTLMAKANEQKSGDELSLVSAKSAAKSVATRLVLTQVPMCVLQPHRAL